LASALRNGHGLRLTVPLINEGGVKGNASMNEGIVAA